nr:alpha/beta hydrolase [Exiguobacterium algae]
MEQYEAYVQDLPIQVESEMVETRYGKTHVLVGGPRNGKPLFLFQGGNCINPMTLSWFLPLFEHYRIYAPDTIGHPGYSEESRISAQDESFAFWSEDLMNHFNVKESSFVGPSYGGGIILRLATYMPDRITRAVLVSPAGIRLGSKLKMIQKILIPLLFYRLTNKERHLRKLTDTMSNNEMKERDRQIIGQIFKFTKLEQDMPKLTTRQELVHYKAPMLIIGGTQDIFFPSSVVKSQAEQIFTGPFTFLEYEMGHFPSEEQLREINEEIQSFLQKHVTEAQQEKIE